MYVTIFFKQIQFLVITGSSDGIGKEYSLQLAQRGLNIVLVARNESKLIQVAREIGKKTKKNMTQINALKI